MRHKRILVIDDEKDFTKMIKTSLETRGEYKVRTQNIPSRAIDTIRTFKPDLILLDIMMPGGINGDEIARRIKDDEEIKDIPIVFLTAMLTEKEVVERDSIIGGYPFIAKPVKIEELIDYIEKTLTKEEEA